MATAGFPVFRVETQRSCERQYKLLEKGRTYADCGQSAHTSGHAVDWAFKADKPWSMEHPWELLGAACEALGLTWGGRWPTLRDYGHCELP